MTAQLTEDDVFRALDQVIDPELDEPITGLGFVRSVQVCGRRVEVHLRLPTSFCAPNFAYLMAADAKDAVVALPGILEVIVELDDHHDSDIINRGLAVDAGYVGTFGHEAESDLNELRATFQRKAHTAAMERALSAHLRARPELIETAGYDVALKDLVDDDAKRSLLRRRASVGLSLDPSSPVLVDERGLSYPPEQAALALRRARATRISIDGNAHFCRGLLQTRYPGSESSQTVRPTENFFPISVLTASAIARRKIA